MEPRHVALRARADAARRIPRHQLLRTLALGAAAIAHRQGPAHACRDRGPHRRAARGGPLMPVLRASDVGKVLLKGGRARVDEPVPPRFKAGDRVRARNINPLGHTRLPRYARGRQGVIDRDHGVFIFPDTHAMGLGPKPQHCYAVRFAARGLWGPEASARAWIYIDLWDDHLDPA